MKTLAANSAYPQRGVAAVELALVLPVFLVMLAFPLYLGRALWHYTVIERAAQDAARYLSTVPLSEIRNSNLAPAVTAVANDIVTAEMAELAPGPDAVGVTVSCDTGKCLGFTTPVSVNVTIQLQISDIFFSGLTSLTVPLTTNITYPYLGR